MSSRLGRIAGTVGIAALVAALMVVPASGVVQTADVPPTAPAGAVLDPTPVLGSSAPVPSVAGLRSAIEAVVGSVSWGSYGGVVIDPATGTVLYDEKSSTPLTPASTTKVFTTMSVLSAYGPDYRIATKVVEGPAAGQITIVGGGDPSLSVGMLTELAASTAAALAPGASVTLGYDTSLFSGPALAEGWLPSYPSLGVVAPIVSLMVDGGRVSPDYEQRSETPGMLAAQAFSDALVAAGVSVTDIGKATATTGAKELARVESVPMSELIVPMLTDSDNTAAEMLAHLAGVKVSGTGSFDSGSAAVEKMLVSLGISTTGVELVDGSGLSRIDDTPPAVLGELMAAAVTGNATQGWAMLDALPIAGFTGTLADRFHDAATQGGAGLVRAKTGTLTGVVALTGYTRDADGRVLVFALMGEDIGDIESARTVLDEAATAITGCGCR